MSGKTRSTIGSILMFVGSVTTAPFSSAIWWLIAGAALSHDGAKRQKKEAERRARAARSTDAFKGNVRSSHEQHMLVFGDTRIGGIICTEGSKDGPDMPAQYFYIGIEHCIAHAGGCEGITAIYIDETKIPLGSMDADPNVTDANVVVGPYNGLVKVRHYRGTGTQNADAELVSLGIDASTDYRRGIAWTKVMLKRPVDEAEFRRAYKFGFPNITVLQKGLRVYDPRKDSTAGGAGLHRSNDPLTWEWSSNPILCAATYSIMAQLDGGEQIPSARNLWATVASGASTCDELITTPAGQQKRFTCNGALSTSDDVKVNLQKILDSCQGKRVPVSGQFAYHAAQWRTETFAIDQTWLVGPVELQASSANESLYNSVRVNFNDAGQDYKTIEAVPYINAAYETEDGGPLGPRRSPQDLTLPMVSDPYEAQYLSQIHGKKSRNQKTLSLPCNLKAWDLELEETGTVTLPGVDLSPYRWRLDYWEPTETGANLVLIQDSAAVYDPEAFTIPPAAGALTIGEEVPAAPNNLTAIGLADGIHLKWEPPARYAYATLQIERSPDGGTGWVVIGSVAKGTTSFIDPVAEGTWYYRVRGVSSSGTPGAYVGSVSATAKQAASAESVAAYNAGFEDGDQGWTKQAGWSIVYDASNKRSGSWCAKIVGTGASVTAALLNKRKMPVALGDLVLAIGFLKSTAAANGNGYVRIGWFDVNGSELSTSNGNLIAPGETYNQSRVSAAAPAGAAYANVQFAVTGFSSAAGEAWFADDSYLTVTPKNQDEVPDGTTYQRTKATALTAGEVDLSKAGVLNRTADNLAESATRKWAAESGAQVVTGKSIDILADGTTYQRTKATALTAGEVDLSKAGVIGKNLGNIADDATYGRTKLTALTSGEVDMTKSGVLNRTADNIAEAATRKWAAESGAQVVTGKSIDILADGVTYQRQAGPSQDSLVMQGTASGSTPAHSYRQISTQSYSIVTGDSIEYDVFLDPANPNFVGGFVDFLYNAGASAFRDSGLSDQNSLSVGAGTDLSSWAKGRWYHRKVSLSSLNGHTVTSWAVALEGDAAGTYKARIANLKITNGSTLKAVIYSAGNITAPVWLGLETNYSNVKVYPSDLSGGVLDNDIIEGVTYQRTKATALTSGEVDLSKAGVLNRNADNIAEAATRKWAAESGAQVVTGKSIDILADGTTYQRTKATALTAGEVDLSKAGVLNRTADNLAESATRKWAAESGADVTSGKSINVLTDVKSEPQFFTFTQTRIAVGSGSVTIPTGARLLTIRGWGAGGGGARNAVDSTDGGGGGGGGTKKTVLLRSTDWGGTISYTVGAKGLGRTATNGNGTAGGATTVTSTGLSFTNLNLIANGGGGGTTSGGGSGGTASGGDTNVAGSSGTNGLGGASGVGGNSAVIDSIFGTGGGIAKQPGGGGDGAEQSNGANGADGMVTFTWSG